jgi:branched-chain amino acid transport system permease protein
MTIARRIVPEWASPAKAALLVAALVALALLPVFGLSTYSRNLVTLSFLSVSGALAWNWLGGYVGQVSFGHAAFFGLGGFVTARLLLATSMPPVVGWIVGGLVAGIFSLGAHPMLRLRGPYFSIATIGLGEACRLIFTYWEAFTGGSSGVSLPIELAMKRELYWWALAFLGIVVVASVAIRRSPLGLSLLAIKSDVEAAADVGVNPALYQDIVLFLSATAIGVTGGLYASFFIYIEPNDMFGFDRSIGFVLMAVIGGLGTILGPVLGAAVFVILREFLLASYPQLYLGLYGALLIIVILFEPLGLTGLFRRIWRTLPRRRRPGKPVPADARPAAAAKVER